MKTSISNVLFKALLFSPLLISVGATQANGWNGGNNFFGGNNNGYNDWPVWTPMYWMEEMFGNNNGFGNNRFRSYGNPYQSPYISPYSRLNQYSASPYMTNSYGANRYPGQQAYRYVPYASVYPQNRYYGSRTNNIYSPFGNSGMSPFSNFGGRNYSNPFSTFSGTSSPFSSFGGTSPWNSFGSPMSPMGGGMPGMSPLGGMGGFGSPMSPMSMGTMGVPGMSPMSGFGGSPFGSGFTPFR